MYPSSHFDRSLSNGILQLPSLLNAFLTKPQAEDGSVAMDLALAKRQRLDHAPDVMTERHNATAYMQVGSTGRFCFL